MRLAVNDTEPQQSEKHAVYFDPVKTQVIISGEARARRPLSPSGTFQLRRDGIGGLSGQLANIDRALAFRMGSARFVGDQHLLGSTALLFHGPEGTGKSMLLERLAECPWKEVYRINPSTHPKGQITAVTETFDNARDNQPSLILMDNLDKFLDKADALVERLRIQLAKLEGSEVVVAAAGRSVYDVDTSLRTRSTFKNVLEVFPPDVRQREDILRHILGPGRKLDSIDFAGLSARTHGFVGRDIDHLCGLARSRRVERADEALDDESKATLPEILEKTDFVYQEDFDAVIDQVQPTVLKESILEVPKVRWTDIAGVDHVRAVMESITIRPFKVRPIYIHTTFHPTNTPNSTPTSTSNSAPPNPAKASSSTAPQAVQKPSSPKPSPPNPTKTSSPSRAPSSSKCTSANPSAQSATSSGAPARQNPASFSSTRSIQLARVGA